MRLTFSKYQGTGNDFIMIDDREDNFISMATPDLISRLCHRKMGIGADGLIILKGSQLYDFEMKYFNSDGHVGSMCGNGGRCSVAFSHDLGESKTQIIFEAVDGIHHATLDNGQIDLQMNSPYGYQEISPSEVWLNTGSPHFVSFQEKHLDELDVYELGRNIRYSEPFAEEGTNVNFVNEIDEHTLSVRTYERGVEDETMSCGTGVIAVVYAYLKKNNWPNTHMNVQTPGGKLSVSIENPETDHELVRLSGPAVKVFEGSIDI